MAVSDDVFDTIANAKASGGGNYILDGAYLYEVENLILEKKHTGTCFIAELRVREAKAVEVSEPMRKPEEWIKNDDGSMTPKPIPFNKVGSTCSLVCNFNASDSAAGNAKAFMLGLDGTPESEIDPEEFKNMLRAATSKGQPLRGALVRNTTFRKPIKTGNNAGKPFTANKWQFVPQTAEEIATRRAALDATPA